MKTYEMTFLGEDYENMRDRQLYTVTMVETG
jgi:hypothetical protein